MTGSMAINQPNHWLNSYAQQALMGGDDTFMGIGPICNDSVFGGGMMGGFPGMGGGFGGGMMGGFPGMGYPGMGGANMTLEQYLAQQEKMQDFQIDSQVRYQKKMNGAQFEVQADDDAVTRQIGILQGQIKANNQDQVMDQYNKLVQSIQAKLQNSGFLPSGISKEKSRAVVQAHAEKLYFLQTGKSIADELREHGNGSFVHGMKKILSFGFSNNRTAEENIADISGTKLDKSETAKKFLGGFAILGTIGGVIAAIVTKGKVKPTAITALAAGTVGGTAAAVA